jgi:hypothetical protein
MRYISGTVAVYSRDKVTPHSKTGRITKAALREALRHDPEQIDFRTDEGYVNARGLIQYDLSLEVREGDNLVAVVEAQRGSDGTIQAVVR